MNAQYDDMMYDTKAYYKNYTGEPLNIIRFKDSDNIIIDDHNMQIYTDESNCECITLYPSGYLCLEEQQEFIVRIDSWKAQGVLYEEIELPEEVKGTVYIIDESVFSKLAGINGRKDFATPQFPVISNNTKKFLGFNALKSDIL